MFDFNQRKYPRANYPCELTLWPDDGRNEIILTQTSNLGVGGVMVMLLIPLYLKTKLEVRIAFPNSTTAFKCRGVVVRSLPQKNESHLIAIQFEALDELKHAFLSGQVSELIDLEEKGKS